VSTNHRERLENLRAVVLKKISSQTSAGDSSFVIAEAPQLQLIDQVLGEYRALDKRAEAILNNGAVTTSLPIAPSATAIDGVPGRDHGVQIRSGFLERARKRGLELTPQRGAIYKAPVTGLRVGLAVATERQPNRWFLGLTDGAFDAAVLICQERNGRTIDLCLPRSFVSQHAHQLSRSGGQVKFNVARRGSQLTLTLPQVGPVPVDAYVGAIDHVAS
jgi:hypothetical protein